MNLKPNIWTLLFLIAAIALTYQYLQPQEVITLPSEPTTVLDWESPESPIYSLSISRDTVIQQMAYYRDSIAIPSKALQTNGEFPSRINNLDIRHFKIEEHLMATMMDINKGENVYAIPVLQAVGRNSLMIDIVFSNVDPDSSHFSTSAMIFDFSSPCPTLCNE